MKKVILFGIASIAMFGITACGNTTTTEATDDAVVEEVVVDENGAIVEEDVVADSLETETVEVVEE